MSFTYIAIAAERAGAAVLGDLQARVGLADAEQEGLPRPLEAALGLGAAHEQRRESESAPQHVREQTWLRWTGVELPENSLDQSLQHKQQGPPSAGRRRGSSLQAVSWSRLRPAGSMLAFRAATKLERARVQACGHK